MKRILSITGIFSLSLILLSSFSLRENPQDPPRGKKGTKHIKLVKVDEDGKKMELDTIIEGENVFVWNGDTIGSDHGLKWVSKDDFDFDMDMDFDVDVEETADGKVIIMKSGKGGAPHAPKVIMMKKQNSGNVIDLSDPGIISYDKKELKDGKEKITIIRNKPVEGDIELHDEIIMHGAGSAPMIIHEGHPTKVKTVKVITDDDGNISIFEDGEEKEFKAGEGKDAFITKEGNVYHIKETKEGDKKKVEVEVEVNEEKKK